MNDELEFNEKIRVYRKRSKLSQQELANMCHVSRNTISEVERGVGNPTLSTLMVMAYALNLKLSIEITENDS